MTEGLSEKYLKDYTRPNFVIKTTELIIELGESLTVVKSKLTIERNGDHQEPLVLDGESMRLIDVEIDGDCLLSDQYIISDKSLTISEVPNNFELSTTVEINPIANKALTGLYKSNSCYCTQCESHGFRNITYHLDRPDVLSVFTTTIIADLDSCPLLLSNGNKIDEGKLPAGRHWVKWHDPHPKPTYLFAMVAGSLDKVADKFTTLSGKAVDLEVYVKPGKAQHALFALSCLKKAMRWDEQVFNREYDLAVYMIVAVNDFNFGAMENKGLNIFNDKYILAAGDCATDADFLAVDVVVAHEYFHNWSGNRVTCRDWFQLSLKEGLTVFREQKYTEDVSCPQLERVRQAKLIEQFQFKEDAGPMSHPIRPSSYIDMNNFYTVTVYNKGSEVIRMLETMSSSEDFVKATDAYFEKFDGQAVTTDDFINVMQESLGLDLTQFRLWYDQAGTPEVSVNITNDADTYQLEFTQKHYATFSQKIKSNLVIPIKFNIFNADGQQVQVPELSHLKSGDAYLLNLTASSEVISFKSEESELLISALESFSAPVKLIDSLSLYERLLIAANTTDGYQKFKQLQKAHLECISSWMASKDETTFSNLSDLVVDAHEKILLDPNVSAALKPEILALPSESFVMQLHVGLEIDKLILVMKHFRTQLSERLSDVYAKVYSGTEVNVPYHYNADEAGKRSLRNYALSMLNIVASEQAVAMAVQQYKVADNMTDRMAALVALSKTKSTEFENCMQEFYKSWENDPLVIDKWLAIQAMTTHEDALAVIKKLLGHKAFDQSNPNRVRALIGNFSHNNFAGFHRADGEAYKFLASQVIKIQAFNPQLAARIVAPLLYYNNFDKGRQAIMKSCLQTIIEHDGLNPGVMEPVQRALAD